ncbi:MAG: phosphotransferase enzyme family protein [Salinivirgaceae bacterium]|nr:MAG: phosphotransferase enzyme family protein [Salinivirgaceae bacterium]
MNIDILKQLFSHTTGANPTTIQLLKQSGSSRQYARLSDGETSVIGCYNENVDENEAFFHLTEIFRKQNLNVPQILQIDESRKYYLQVDLGDNHLYDKVINRTDQYLGSDLIDLYKNVLGKLVDFQTVKSDLFDHSKFYPVHSFNRASVGWDLDYFKYYFLKLNDIAFSDRDLNNDFETLIDHVLNDNTSYFMYRDFQSRNIMLVDDEPWFIDYQGGRRGPLAYDVASLLYQAKARITDSDRSILLKHYIEILKTKVDIDEKRFLNYYYPIALIRVLQTLGAYGYRGFYQKKSHFLQSINYALDNLVSLLPNLVALEFVPTLKRCLLELIDKRDVYKVSKDSNFQVVVNSFSYINGGVPNDYSGHGGGYAFDCRLLPNPGRLQEYKKLTGMDADVQAWLKQYPEVDEYLNDTFSLIKRHVEAYQERGFSYLAVNFGCTGGQHRSVYCAENVSRMLKEMFPDIQIKVNHMMQHKSYTL